MHDKNVFRQSIGFHSIIGLLFASRYKQRDAILGGERCQEFAGLSNVGTLLRRRDDIGQLCRAPLPVSDRWLSSIHFSTPPGLAAR